VDVTSGGPVDDTSRPSSGTAGVTESYLLNPAYKAEIQIDRMDCAAPSAPDAAALSGASPGTAQENGEPTFEALWRAYGHNRAKKEARAAWNALPAEVDRAAIIDAAIAWQESWAAQGKPDAPRFTLARWLRDERFDEDAPRGFQKPENPEKPAKVKQRSPAKAASHPFPSGETKLTVTSAELVQGETFSRIALVLTDEAGAAFPHAVDVEHTNADLQAAGQKELSQLAEAAGLSSGISDTSELVGKAVVALVENGHLSWYPPRHRAAETLDPAPVPIAPGEWPAWMDDDAA